MQFKRVTGDKIYSLILCKKKKKTTQVELDLI